MSQPLDPPASSVRQIIAQRSWKNRGGYLGDSIDIQAILEKCRTAGSHFGFDIEELPAPPKPSLLALVRPAKAESSKGSPAIYISAGIHGDEPAGPLALLQLLDENRWPKAGFSLLPCLNPTGFLLKRRENDEGTDLNRQYLQPKAEETLAHINWLKGQPNFELCLCLHEDWEAHGFYVYELNPDNRPSLAEPMVQAAAKICPVDLSEVIEGRPARDGIVRPSVDPRSRSQWPESFYLLTHKTRLTYTLEAPSDFSLQTRVAVLVAAVRAALDALLGGG